MNYRNLSHLFMYRGYLNLVGSFLGHHLGTSVLDDTYRETYFCSLIWLENITMHIIYLLRMPPISRALVEALVREHRVVVFSKTWCPFCNKVKDTLNKKFVPFHRVELDKELVSFLELWTSVMYECFSIFNKLKV